MPALKTWLLPSRHSNAPIILNQQTHRRRSLFNLLSKFGKRKEAVPSPPPPPVTTQWRLLVKKGGGVLVGKALGPLSVPQPATCCGGYLVMVRSRRGKTV